ncbi:MAG TPA: hypothetical protein VIF15_04570 [Polyangiaceae bacterium]|jgi:hypothetical protein
MHKAPLLVLAILAATAAALVAANARADGPGPVDQPEPPDEAARHSIDRTWLYLDDAKLAAPLTAIGMSNASYTSVGSSPTRVYSPYRALGANTAQPGAMASLGGEVGLVPRVSVMALGQLGFGGVSAGASAGAVAGLRFQLAPAAWRDTHLVASLGYVREAWAGPVYSDDSGAWTPAQNHGDDGAWAQAAFAQDLGRLRLGTTVHAEHVFSTGRDPVDVMVQLGASYRVAGAFRAGVEYVGQDIEETWSPAAEAGARHFVGPTASMQLLQDRLTMVAGPAVGLSAFSPSLLGRFALAYGF